MSRFISWYVSEQLRHMGWPKQKGVFRKEIYVDANILDVAVELGIHILVGLGAGRPQFGLAILADTFNNNPWTIESTTKLLSGLKDSNDGEIKRNPGLPPWKALYSEHRLATSVTDIPWKDLADSRIQSIWGMAAAESVYWGLTHEKDMPIIFDQDKADYEKTSIEAIPYGLSISEKYPWESLEHFYTDCENFVLNFESVRPPLCEVPIALKTAPEFSRG